MGVNLIPRNRKHLDRLLPKSYPQRIKIELEGKSNSLGWHRRSGKYRFCYAGPNGKEKTLLFGPDPTVAEDDALRDAPHLLAGESPATVAEPVKKKLRKRSERPQEISVRCFDHDYTLMLDKYGHYKGWAILLHSIEGVVITKHLPHFESLLGQPGGDIVLVIQDERFRHNKDSP